MLHNLDLGFLMTRFRLNSSEENMTEMKSHLLYSVLSGRQLSLQGQADSSFSEKLGMNPWLLFQDRVRQEAPS